LAALRLKQKYIYESRHRHAVRRLRGKDGKFLASNIVVIQRDLNMRGSSKRRKEEESLKTK
jgi:hypothetical protein